MVRLSSSIAALNEWTLMFDIHKVADLSEPSWLSQQQLQKKTNKKPGGTSAGVIFSSEICITLVGQALATALQGAAHCRGNDVSACFCAQAGALHVWYFSLLLSL